MEVIDVLNLQATPHLKPIADENKYTIANLYTLGKTEVKSSYL